MKNKRDGFTLAEVLITLTIVGVIAAITIPNLTRKWRDHADVQKVKQAYSILSNAYKMCIAENGTMETWDWGNNVTFPYIIDFNRVQQNKLTECMLPYLKVKKYCGLAAGCVSVPSDRYKTLFGTINRDAFADANYGGKAVLENGMVIAFGATQLSANGYSTWSGYGPIRVDINGSKGPNRYGYDVFFFNVLGEKGIGAAYYNYPNIKTSLQYYCNLNRDNYVSGLSCSNWVLRKGNMDYKYREVSNEW